MYQLFINGSYITEGHSDFIQLVILDRITSLESPRNMTFEMKWIDLKGL